LRHRQFQSLAKERMVIGDQSCLRHLLPHLSARPIAYIRAQGRLHRDAMSFPGAGLPAAGPPGVDPRVGCIALTRVMILCA
jgi:hypothetical protein